MKARNLPPDAPSDVIAEMYAPPARRWLGLGMLYLLGAMLIVLAFVHPPRGLSWLGFLIATGGFVLWGAERMRQATAVGIRLTDSALTETTGQVIIALEDIDAVDRGLFAFKPSNGFLIKARTRMTRVWRPGLYWVAGRYIGVGGVTSRAQAKLMSETISQKLEELKQDKS